MSIKDTIQRVNKEEELKKNPILALFDVIKSIGDTNVLLQKVFDRKVEPPVVNVEAPVVNIPAPIVNVPAPVVNIPEQPTPIVNVPAPIVNVEAPVINVPEQPAPIVNVNTQKFEEGIDTTNKTLKDIFDDLKARGLDIGKVQLVDKDGKPLDLTRMYSTNGSIGGRGYETVWIKDATNNAKIDPSTKQNQDTSNTHLTTIASNTGQAVMSVENALSVAAYDLNAASYSGSTTITDDYLLDSIEFDFTTAISKTISITTSTGAEIFTSTDSYQSIILTRNDLGQACNANDNITITVTQTAGACSMDLKVKIMKGSNTLVGNPTVKLQAYSPEESAYEEVRSVDNSMFVINYLDLVGIGRIDGHIPFRGFGQRQSLSTAVTGDDIWEGTATTIPIPPDAGDLMSLVSTSAQDGVAGTGVLSVDVHYIDPTGNPQSTVVTMNGTTAVNTGILMRFIQSIHTETVGSNGTAVGTVSIYKTGDVATVYNVIKPGGNVSLSSARMVPLGKTFYIKDTFLSGSSNKSISVRLRVTSTFEDVLNPRVFQYKEISFLQDSTKSSNKSVVIKAPALSIIKYTAYSTQTGGDISTSYEGWYE